jgi:hypothetical protein
MRRMLVFACAATALIAGCAPAADPGERKPQQAGQPLDPVEVAARVTAVQVAAAIGDEATMQGNLEALQEDMRRSIRLADPARTIDRESARLAARQVPGVRSVAWVDRSNLFVIVDRNEAKSYDTIDRICLRLESLGDTLGVVVNLQSGAAVNGDDLQILGRNCQLPPGERALLQADRQLDVIPGSVRSQHRVNNPGTVVQQSEEWKRRNRESMKLIEDSTPEM